MAPMWARVLAVVLHLPVTFVLYLAAGLVVPPIPWTILNLIGVGLFVLTIVLARRKQWAALAIPFVSVAFWFAFVGAGGAMFDWTA